MVVQTVASTAVATFRATVIVGNVNKILTTENTTILTGILFISHHKTIHPMHVNKHDINKGGEGMG